MQSTKTNRLRIERFGDFSGARPQSFTDALARTLCLNQPMFLRKMQVEYEQDGARHPCPLKWLDSFSMRNFTNASVFDDTLPVADGLIEVGANVPLEQLREAMEDWFRRKSYLPKNAHLVVEERS